MATILVIDDDVALLASLSVQLEQAGYTVLKASEIGYAEETFVAQRPDLVLLEVRTNRDSGWNLLERFAGQVPVIVVSGSGREEDVVRGLEAGAVDYIPKPYRSSELLVRVRVRLSMLQSVPAQAIAVSAPAPAASSAVAPAPAAPAAVPTPAPASSPVAPASAAPVPMPTAASAAPASALAVAAPAVPATNPVTSPLPGIDSAPPRSEPAKPASRRGPDEQQVEAVFMSEAEEMALLRMGDRNEALRPEQRSVPPPLDDTLSLGQKLYLERQRRRFTLVQAENELKIRMSYLQAMEDNKFTLLPRGPLAGQMLRSYAAYLGLDKDALLEEFQRSYASDPFEPLPALGGPQVRRPLPRWLIPVTAVVLALAVSLGGLLFFDPGGMTEMADTVRALIIAPTAVPTPAPTPIPPPTATPSPSATATATATRIPTATPTLPTAAPSGTVLPSLTTTPFVQR